ncbi:hypothetical protein BDR06DRAFT_900676 [Suillus hirtellus]|nr:hypothetical protein BDR06DRAFT_900676 [Suillus hirtellus]
MPSNTCHAGTAPLFSLNAAADYTLDKWPLSRQVQSKHKLPIEGFGGWKQDGKGHSIRQAIFVSRDESLYNSNDPLHECASFQLAIATLVQQRLDEFRLYWNNHRLSSQKKKVHPKGTPSRHVWLAPESVRAFS